ncbi:MAG: citrate synthase [Opitutales bacterium]|nr:citrate synthase [Opitutales bacterium]
MAKEAKIIIEGKEYTYPVIEGTEGEKAIDMRTLRSDSGYITFDEGYGNTGSCQSEISFINGEEGILRHRGYAIEDLAENSDFIEVAYLVIYGALPTASERTAFSERIRSSAMIHMSMNHLFEGVPNDAPPMAILSSMLNSLGCYYKEYATNNHQHDLEHFDDAVAITISKVRTIAAMTYRMSNGLPFVYPKMGLRYVENFLHMMFSNPYDEYIPQPEVAKALNVLLLLHADHEQNCSTSTVRMVASSGANLFPSVASAVCALWGPLHGGANMAVIKMLESIAAAGDDGSQFIEDAKSGRSGKRLMGFGHRVYRNYDPRAKILGKYCDKLLDAIGIDDQLLTIARNLEQAALKDDYFVERKLYPNVDFYSGIIMRAIGIPLNMFTVMFAIGRMPGWIANWREVASHEKGRIYRPRQIYQGPKAPREYVKMEDRPEK